MSSILQIPNYQYPHIGGIEQVSRDIARAFSNPEIKQKMICFNEEAKDGQYVCHRGETVHDIVDGIEVIRCGCFAKAASQSLSLTYPKQLDQVMKEFKPDIVIFHYPNPFVASFLTRYLKWNFKFILYWHLDITKQKYIRTLFHKQNLNLLERADKIVATSPNYIDESPYLSKYREKCVVIPNCIDVKRLRLNEESKKISQEIRNKYFDKLICFSVGRHVPYKGYSYLIEAAKRLDSRFLFFIGGSGPLTDQLKTEASSCQNVKFLGRISDEELTGYLDACDIFCFPSITKNEAFGIALAEGMYFGKPAVTFTIPGSGVNYVNLNGVTGIECPNGDSKAYAEALKRLADNPQMRIEYGQNGRKRVIDNFTFDKFNNNVHILVN